MSTDNGAKIAPRSFANMQGIGAPTDNLSSISTEPTNIYTKREETALFTSTQQVTPRAMTTGALTPTALSQYFAPIHEHMSRVLRDSKQLKQLAPEIDQAARIRVSSILSPTDYQEGVFEVKLTALSEVDPELAAELSAYFKTHLNEVLNIGNKCDKWCTRCLYGIGSVPILMLPSSYLIGAMADGRMPGSDYLVKYDGGKNFALGLESLSPKEAAMTTESIRDVILNRKFLTEDTKAANEAFQQEFTKETIGNESGIFYDDIMDRLISAVGTDDLITYDANGRIPKDLKSCFEALTVDMKSKLGEDGMLKISENPEIMRFAHNLRNSKKDRANQKYAEAFAPDNYHIQELVSLQKYATEKDNGKNPYCFWEVLPSEAVFPIISPHDPEQHLGYLVAIDELGNPVTAKEVNDAGCGVPGGTAANTALFGKSKELGLKYGRYAKSMAATVFDALLDKYIHAKLKKMSFDEVTVEKGNSIAMVMFHRMLENKKTSLVFVPTDLMTYLCFDYRDNGTGKSLIEDIHFILSLRATFMIASVMAMANDSVSHHNIDITFDETTTNYEQVLQEVANAYIKKKRMDFSTDPSDISASIAKTSLTLSPKNMQGVAGFELNPTTQPGQSVRVDSGLMDAFDSMLVTFLGVPYASLNQVNENEYSRSVATVNLFFGRAIKLDQDILCKAMAKFYTTYIKYSPKILSDLKKMLKNRGSSAAARILAGKVSTTKPSNDTGTNNELEDTHVNHLVAHILSSMKLSLPTPCVAPDKAQFAEIRDYLSTVSELAEVLFGNDLVMSSDQKGQEVLTFIRAKWKRMVCDNLFHRLGGFNTLELPSIEELGLEQADWSKFTQILQNLHASFSRDAKVFGGEADGGFGGGGFGDSGGGFGDEMGGGDDSMGGDSFDMGGSDESSDEYSSAEEPTQEENEPTPDTPESQTGETDI